MVHSPHRVSGHKCDVDDGKYNEEGNRVLENVFEVHWRAVIPIGAKNRRVKNDLIYNPARLLPARDYTHGPSYAAGGVLRNNERPPRGVFVI
jgi:hypothetical protein